MQRERVGLGDLLGALHQSHIAAEDDGPRLVLRVIVDLEEHLVVHGELEEFAALSRPEDDRFPVDDVIDGEHVDDLADPRHQPPEFLGGEPFPGRCLVQDRHDSDFFAHTSILFPCDRNDNRSPGPLVFVRLSGRARAREDL